MDYKEKYEQALAKAKKQYNYPRMRSSMGILEEIFPELKETEDERIRKALIQGFHEYNSSFSTFGGIKVEDILAWVEKQKSVEWTEEDEAFLEDIICKVKSDLILNKNEKDWLKQLEERMKA